MWRWVSRILPVLLTLLVLTLGLCWLFALEESEDPLLLLDREQNQHSMWAGQENLKLIHQQIMESEHPDIYHRSKFQKQQVKRFCESYSKKPFALPEEAQRNEMYRHLLFDDRRKTIFCFVEKAGCTNMKRLMLISVGELAPHTAQDQWVGLKHLERGLRHASFLNKSLTEKGRNQRLRDYFKFTVLRHPLERLVSSYRNKIEPPLQGHSLKFPNYIKRRIFEQYRPVVYHYWLKSGANYNISISFSEFVEYYIESLKEGLNSHIRPFTRICHPCTIPFDFHIHFSNFSQDVRMVINRVGMNQEHFHDSGLHQAENSTAAVMIRYYQQLSRMQRARLFDVMRDELLYYYHLFPAERNSHWTILGIEERLYRPHTA